MKVQTTARDEHLRSLDGVGSGAVGSAAGDVKAVRAATEVVAVVSGEGLKRLYQSLGTSRIVDGGQSLNPSAQELLRAVEETSAAGVVLLPNNRNIILAAEQVARLTDRHVVVVPTRSMQAGLAAMVAFDSSADTAANLEEMSAAVEHVATGGVTRAVRASVVDGLNVREGDYIGLVDDQVVATGEDMGAIVESVAGQLVAGEREIVTLFVGDGSAEEEVEGLAERLRSLYPDLELEVHQGDQPLYPLLMAAE
jgi:dihydroxyacetone kinase-like predicted kinase